MNNHVDRLNKTQIISLLQQKHASFLAYINGLSEEQFLYSHSQKWTAGQQLQHIHLSVRPVALGLSLPKVLLRLLFGKARRSSRTFEALKTTYLGELENGAQSSRPFIPKSVALKQRQAIANALTGKVNSLCSKIESFSEDDLDSLILPHPVLGKLTMREMLYFTIYHVEHHEALVRKYVGHLAHERGPLTV
jgi:hypothetical protein